MYGQDFLEVQLVVCVYVHVCVCDTCVYVVCVCVYVVCECVCVCDVCVYSGVYAYDVIACGEIVCQGSIKESKG